jgi:hypothetical protein
MAAAPVALAPDAIAAILPCFTPAPEAGRSYRGRRKSTLMTLSPIVSGWERRNARSAFLRPTSIKVSMFCASICERNWQSS